MTTVIVIPARWGSTRFPGKPLAELRGMTVLQRVVAVARRAAEHHADTRVLIATDDQRIVDHARSLHVPVVFSAEEFDCGTARAFAATRTMPAVRAVVNLQGDAPFVTPSIVSQVLMVLEQGASVATPVVHLDWPSLDALRKQKISSPFSGTTCIRADGGRALWFSKMILPAIRNQAEQRASTTLSPVFQHIGLYGYTMPALEEFVAQRPSRYEALEGLEQLRFIEARVPIDTVVVERPRIWMSGIDTPDDLVRAGRLIDDHGEPEWM